MLGFTNTFWLFRLLLKIHQDSQYPPFHLQSDIPKKEVRLVLNKLQGKNRPKHNVPIPSKYGWLMADST